MLRFTLVVLIFFKISTEVESFYLTSQTSMLNIEDGIAYSVDTQKATVYAYNNLTQLYSLIHITPLGKINYHMNQRIYTFIMTLIPGFPCYFSGTVG